MTLESRWRHCLETLRAEGRYRSLALPKGIDFSSNDYLGLGKIPQPAAADLPRSGLASRLLRGHHALWDEVEEVLADWHNAEATLTFSSGYVANEGLLATIIEAHDWVASDQLNHASLIDGCRLSRAERFIFRHNDLDHLETSLRTAAQVRPVNRQLFIITESLFGMEGDRAPLAEMAKLAQRYQAHLIVDEAHATGCFGNAGSGLVDFLGLRSGVLATIHTGGKALGVTGAYVCGSRLLRELLINHCRHLIFTTALPPQLSQWWLDALPQVRALKDGRAALHHNARLFRDELARRNLTPLGSDYIVPIVLGPDGSAVQAALALQHAGYDIRAIRPPTVPLGSARLRISIHSDHDETTLRDVASLLAQVIENRPREVI